MRVLVTGFPGFVGGAVAARLDGERELSSRAAPSAVALAVCRREWNRLCWRASPRALPGVVRWQAATPSCTP